MTVGNCTHKGCGSSTALKREVAELLEEGRGRDEILALMARRHGDTVLAAPTKRGFNLTAWVLPFVALGSGALVVTRLLHRWTTSRPEGGEPPDLPDTRYSARIREELSQLDG